MPEYSSCCGRRMHQWTDESVPRGPRRHKKREQCLEDSFSIFCGGCCTLCSGKKKVLKSKSWETISFNWSPLPTQRLFNFETNTNWNFWNMERVHPPPGLVSKRRVLIESRIQYCETKYCWKGSHLIPKRMFFCENSLQPPRPLSSVLRNHKANFWHQLYPKYGDIICNNSVLRTSAFVYGVFFEAGHKLNKNDGVCPWE